MAHPDFSLAPCSEGLGSCSKASRGCSITWFIQWLLKVMGLSHHMVHSLVAQSHACVAAYATLGNAALSDISGVRPLQQAPASPDFLQYWVGNHSLNMAALNKPLLLEEFGVEVEPPASTGAAGSFWWIMQHRPTRSQLAGTVCRLPND